MDQTPATTTLPKPGPHRWKPGKPKEGGRKVGSTNRMPRLLKEAIILAAELEGQNQHGKDKLVGFLRMVARQDLRSFVMRFCQVSRQTRVRVLPIVAVGSEVTHHLVPIARF